MQLSQGTLLQGGKYKIEKVLGQGGFGITYLAEQTVTIKGGMGEIETTIKVAIKEFFMKDSCNRDLHTSHVSVPSIGSKEMVDRFKKKFIKEAENLAKLKHDYIIKILDTFEENGTAYYVMEHISNGSLGDYINENGAMSEQVALSHIQQIANALDYLHKRKINHLDVKPANILLRADHNIVLIDFGLAKQYDSAGDQTSSTPVGVSKGYAPLEQYQAGGVGQFSPTADIYSLGATLYKLVTGDTPPDATYVNNEGLPELPNHLSASITSAITSAMQPRYKDRAQSISEFLETLGAEETKSAFNPLPVNSERTKSAGDSKPSQSKKRGKLGLIVGVSVVSYIIIGAIFLLWYSNRTDSSLPSQPEPKPIVINQDSIDRIEAERRAVENARAQRDAQAALKAKEEQERIVKRDAEQERIAKEQAEAEAKAQAAAKRQEEIKAEQDALAAQKAKEEQDRIAKEQAEAAAQAQAQAQAQAEAAAKAIAKAKVKEAANRQETKNNVQDTRSSGRNTNEERGRATESRSKEEQRRRDSNRR